MRGMRALRNFKPDDVMAWLIENDGIDFLTKGAESMGERTDSQGSGDRRKGSDALPLSDAFLSAGAAGLHGLRTHPQQREGRLLAADCPPLPYAQRRR